jgi:guanyl-specific ribonuclease Sa
MATDSTMPRSLSTFVLGRILAGLLAAILTLAAGVHASAAPATSDRSSRLVPTVRAPTYAYNAEVNSSESMLAIRHVGITAQAHTTGPQPASVGGVSANRIDFVAAESEVAFGPAPANAWATFERAQAKGSPLAGYKGGSVFANDGRNGAAILPRGDSVTYRKWDVNPKVKGVDRGSERIVTGSDGTAYYTNDHYNSFTQFWGPGE